MYELNLDGKHARLSGELTIYTVGDIKQRIAALPADQEMLDIDLAGVTEIDSAGLQLMLLLKRKKGLAVQYVHHSPEVLRLLDLANLAGTLGDPVVLSAVGGKEE